MNEFLNEALKKIEDGKKTRLDKYGEAMKEEVAKALCEFCRQDAEFAQAVVQGGSFADCMSAVAKGVKNSAISDMKAFGLAVEFFFPGAGIDVKMSINLCASVEPETQTEEKPAGLIIDLSSFF